MVCVPCIFIPILLFLWHKFIQPYVLKFWNPWAKKDESGNPVETKFPFTCSGDSCPFPNKKPAVNSIDSSSNENRTDESKTKSD